jgi:transmembrane 9 superfamily member 2/4
MSSFSIIIACLLVFSRAFYLPGVAPQDFERGQEVEVKVNSLDSVHTQLPLDYYSLPFCRPEQIEPAAENFGEVLSGDLIETSPYSVQMQLQKVCKVVCEMEYTDKEFNQLKEAVQNEYRVNWIIDNMPAATRFYISEKADGADGEIHYEKGFPLGFTDAGVCFT